MTLEIKCEIAAWQKLRQRRISILIKLKLFTILKKIYIELFKAYFHQSLMNKFPVRQHFCILFSLLINHPCERMKGLTIKSINFTNVVHYKLYYEILGLCLKTEKI